MTFLGARDYSMRIWLDPEKLASRNMTAGDVVKALQEQNVQVAAGRIGPAAGARRAGLPVHDQHAGPAARAGRVRQHHRQDRRATDRSRASRDVGRVELGAKNYDVNSYLDGKPCVTLAVFQLPGSNALATADGVQGADGEAEGRASRRASTTRSSTTRRSSSNESIHEVYKTLFEAFVLVFIVVLVFLQNWRATIIPMIAVPVSLIGTFAVMAMLGFSLNNLSLFGLVLAIGIVVDDAIVVVENVERYMAHGPGAARGDAQGDGGGHRRR